MAQTLTDPDILQAALEGLKIKRTQVEAQIAAVEQALGGRPKAAPKAEATTTKKSGKPRRTMSAAARKRIAEAQRARWAQYRKQKQG